MYSNLDSQKPPETQAVLDQMQQSDTSWKWNAVSDSNGVDCKDHTA